MDIGDGAVDIAGTYAVDNRAQSISADDVRKLADSAVQSIAGEMDETGMEQQALSAAEHMQLPAVGAHSVPDVHGRHTGPRQTKLRTARSRGQAGRSYGDTSGEPRDLLDVMQQSKGQKNRQRSHSTDDDMDASSSDGYNSGAEQRDIDDDRQNDENCTVM